MQGGTSLRIREISSHLEKKHCRTSMYFDLGLYSWMSVKKVIMKANIATEFIDVKKRIQYYTADTFRFVIGR